MVRPFVSPISHRGRELFGVHESRYRTAKTMQPFDASIEERGRELYGKHESRYYPPKEYQPFGAAIDDYKRDLYGDYRSRYSRLKVGQQAYHLGMAANGTNWVTVSPWSAGGDGDLKPTVNDIAIYQVVMAYGGWAGVGIWRMLIDGTKVYPFPLEEIIDNGNTMYLGTLSTTVKTGEVCDIQFKSTNAGDGAGQTMFVKAWYAELREV